MYDIEQKIIIDPTGTGFYNNLIKNFRIVQNTLDDWYVATKTAPIRIFKMFQKGYMLIDMQIIPVKKWLNLNFNKFVNPIKSNINCSVLVCYLLKKIKGDKIRVNNNMCVITKEGKNIEQFNGVLAKMKEFDSEFYNKVVEHLSIYYPELNEDYNINIYHNCIISIFIILIILIHCNHFR